MEDVRERILVKVLTKLAERVTVPENSTQGLAAHMMNPVIEFGAELRIQLGFGDETAHALGDKLIAHEGEEARQVCLQIRKCIS